MEFDPVTLRAFVAVTQTGGFTRAAERLHVTQSAVSHQIRRLEEQVGRALLHRTTRKLTLTEDGEDFLRHAEEILGSLDALARRFAPSPVQGLVRFGVPENFMGERLPDLLCRFARAYPAVRLDVGVGMHLDLRAMIKAREIDLAVVISATEKERKGVRGGVVLQRTPLVWVAADFYEAPRSGSLPLAFFPSPCIYRNVGVAALDAAGREWHVVFTSPSQQGLHAAVLAGLAVTVLTRDSVEPGMRMVGDEFGLPALPEADFALVRAEGCDTPAVREFEQLLIEMQAATPARRR